MTETVLKTFPPLTRHRLALYAGASGDHNPLHIDSDFARNEAGQDDVIGHGMLTMAYIARLLTEHYGQDRLKRLSTRFLAPSRIGDILSCEAQEVARDGNGDMRIELHVRTQDGRAIATGNAVVAAPPRQSGTDQFPA